MTTHRVPRGYAKFRTPYNESQEGKRPTFQAVKAAGFLPVARVDEHKHDPIVLLPGTFVGRLPISAGSIDASHTTGRPIAPACPNAYTVTYTATDVDVDGHWGGGVPDIDGVLGTDIVESGDVGASAVSVPALKPVGVVYRPHYAPWMADRFTNYQRNQHTMSWLAWGQNIEIPAMTTKEKLIEIGDLVMLDDTATPSYNPLGAFATHTVGRLQRVTGAAGGDTLAAAIKVSEYVVGRCVGKHKIVSQSAISAGQTLSAARIAANIDEATLNADLDYPELKKVQTVPGLGLAGSGSTGVPPYFDFATADASGDFYALEIEVRV